MSAPIGGQAVLEGVMMRGPSAWAVAVRKRDGQAVRFEARDVAIPPQGQGVHASGAGG